MSRPSASAARAARVNWRVAAWSIATAIVLVFVLANAHLAYVASVSQPDCAAPGDNGKATYRAASPAC
jgi:hypothetical protein